MKIALINISTLLYDSCITHLLFWVMFVVIAQGVLFVYT